jgi:fatty-acyl-CoA synthase
MPNPYLYLVEHARKTPDQPAVVHGRVTLDFKSLERLTSSIGTTLRFEGVRPGQTVLIAGGNQMRNYVLSLAVMHQGAIAAVQSGPSYNPDFCADIAFSFTEIPGFPLEKTVLIDKAWFDKAGATPSMAPAVVKEEDPVVRLFQTSGTTGNPKVVEYGMETIDTQTWPCRMVLLPFGVSAGGNTALMNLKSGRTYFLPTANIHEDMTMIRDYQIDEIMASPSMISELCRVDPNLEIFSNIKSVYSVGSALPKNLVKLINSKYDITFTNRFGAPDSFKSASKIISVDDEESLVGKLFDDVEVRIVDEQFNPVPTGEIGKIGLKSPRTKNGYRNNPDATAKHFVDGFFFSGDEGFVTEDRNLHLVGRSDERINAGGRKIDPYLVDESIKLVGGVLDAAVFGFNKSDGLRGLAAVLVLKPGEKPKSVMDEIAKALGSKRPDSYIVGATIPRNEMGKVLRLELEKLHSEQVRKNLIDQEK